MYSRKEGGKGKMPTNRRATKKANMRKKPDSTVVYPHVKGVRIKRTNKMEKKKEKEGN